MRFPPGYNYDIKPLVHVPGQTIRSRVRPTIFLEMLAELVLSVVFQALLLLTGFRNIGRSVLTYRQATTSSDLDETKPPVVIMMTGSRSIWGMIPAIFSLRQSSRPLYILKSTECQDQISESSLSIYDILSPKDRTQEPIFVVDCDGTALAAKLIKESPKSSIVLIDPSIHPLLITALHPTSIVSPADSDRGDISQLGSGGCIAHIIITPSLSTEAAMGVKRYCQLKSIPFSSISSSSFFDTQTKSNAIIEACKTVSEDQALNLPETPGEMVLPKVIPEDTPPQTPLINLMTGPTMMSTLENISSIGMCLAPPLRTRQRSKSVGTVVGYGHVNGLRRPSMVVSR